MLCQFNSQKTTAIVLSLILTPSFTIVDFIHFQYNSMLFGLLLLSILHIDKQPLLGAFLFSCLLCFKHIFLYVAPAFIVFLFRKMVLVDYTKISFYGTLTLSIATLAPFFFSFFPFIITSNLSNILQRLFPFQRGLTHAYWAPNFWALYSSFDRILFKGKSSIVIRVLIL